MMILHGLSLNFVFETVSNHFGESHLGPFGTRAFDLPLTIVIDDAHFTARPPPIIDFSRNGEPDPFLLAQLA